MSISSFVLQLGVDAESLACIEGDARQQARPILQGFKDKIQFIHSLKSEDEYAIITQTQPIIYLQENHCVQAVIMLSHMVSNRWDTTADWEIAVEMNF